MRNTPTHVGKTSWVSGQKRGLEKHPHARGEDPVVGCLISLEPETPPRTWGRPKNAHAKPHDTGNTPTHVGKTPEYCL